MTKQQRHEYHRSVTALTPYGFTRDDLDTLHRAETTLHRLDEELCNGYRDWLGNWDQRATEKTEAKIDRIERQIMALCAAYDVPVDFNADPRGGAIRLHLPAHESNSWTRESWGIYW